MLVHRNSAPCLNFLLHIREVNLRVSLKQWIFLLLAILAPAFFICAQDRIEFQQWNIEDGLSNQVVRNVAQDSRGFLWMATEQGLNRFDGQTFTHYLNVPGDTNTISHNLLFGLAIDQDDQIWVGSELGLNRYDLEMDQWVSFQYDAVDPYSLSDNYVRTVFVDSHNRVWVGTQNGLNLYDRKSNRFQRIIDDREFSDEFDRKSFSYNRINNVYEDKSGKIWVATDGGGVRIYEPSKYDQFTPFYVRDTLTSRTRIVRKIMQDKAGDFWFGTDAGLARYSEDGGFKHFFAPHASPDSLSDQYVWDMLEGPDGNLWVSTYRGGINLLNREQNRFVGHFDSSSGLSSDQVWSMFKDANSGVWVGCEGAGGVNFYHQAHQKFAHHLPENGHKFNTNKVFELSPDHLLVSTSEGLLSYNLRDRSYLSITNEIADESEYFFFEESAGQAYLMSSKTIYELDVQGVLKQRFVSRLFKENTIITDTHRDAQGNIWIGTISQGLLKVNLKTGAEQIYFNEGNSALYLDSRSISTLASGPDHQLWVASARSGLFLLDPESGDYEQFLYHSEPLFEPTITGIIPVSDSVLWLGTLSNGLVRYNWKTDQAAFFRPEEGQLSQGITAMLLEGNQIWISTKNGLARFDLTTQKFHVFNPEDGLQSPLFNPAIHQGASGKIYFGGNNGFNVLDPDQLVFNESEPKPYFQRLTINDRQIKPGQALIPNGLNKQAHIRLPYDQNYLKLTFTAPSSIQAENNTYAYRLSAEQPWQTLGRNKELTLPNLPAGKYELSVRARNSDGFWGDAAMLVIDILPPFWKTGWFRAVALLGIVLLITSFYRYRLKQISNQKQVLEREVSDRTRELKLQKEKAEEDREIIASQAEELKEMDKVKSKFFANISHELRTPLTLINGPLESLLEREENTLDADTLSLIKTANQNGASLLGLVEEILDLTKLEAGKLPLIENPIPLHELLSDIFDAYQYDLKAKGVTTQLDFQLPENTCLFLDGRKLKKILNNLLSNARKFTLQGDKIQLTAKREGAYLRVSVIDTGRGIDPADLPHVFDRFYQSKKDGKAEGGTGIGLALCMELSKLMKGELSVISQPGEGSEFVLLLPFKPAELQEVQVLDDENGADLKQALNQVIITYNQFFNIDQPTLLLAEDNPAMRRFIASVFEEQFRILEANDGGEALKLLDNERVDLMISDVMMPGMDGFELLNALKGNEQMRSLSVIMLTARAAEEDKLFALTKGVDDYLTKPFNKAELLARVKNILENRVNRQELGAEGNTAGKALNVDQQFLLNLQQIIEDHLDDQMLSVPFLSDEVALSPRQLQRKLKEITGLSPLGFIKEIRLQKAYRYLANREVPSVAEAGRKVGFEKTEYFSTQFIARFGKRPSSML